MTTLSYDELEHLLIGLRAGLDAAELHGSLAGFLAGGGRSTDRDWGEALALEVIQEAQQRDDDTAADLRNLFQHTRTALADPDDSFTPMLPDEDMPLAERADALVAWCRGFLGGIGLANPRARGELPEDAEEAIADLGRIAASELSVEEGEADEDAFVEVLEFVRIAAMLLRDECARAGQRH